MLGRVGNTEPFPYIFDEKIGVWHGSIAPAIAKIATQDEMVVEGKPKSVPYSGHP